MNCFGGRNERSSKNESKCKPQELYKENVRLKEEVAARRKENRNVEDEVGICNSKNVKLWKRYVRCVFLGLFVLTAVFLSYFIWSVVTINDRPKDIKVDQSAHHMHLSAGASDIRQCRKEESASTDLRRTFPDIDYAMLGYDIIKGFPESNSHDPGFTHPIFVVDYTKDLLTADCRYSVPKGFVIIPDVSCVTSFKSFIIRNSLELQKSLAVSVQASGGYGGFSFSASSSYKTISSQVSTGEKVFITSSAKCSYYFSEVDTTQPPSLNPGFLRWARNLQKNSSDERLVKFVKHYGTHFPTSIVFGARYIRKHSMTTETFKTASSREVSVSVQASYSGLFSLGGGFSMDKKERQAASQFSQDVETTTASVGSPPPPNGDATYWASSVKENPVPISYKLKPISELFSPLYMKDSGINYNLMRTKLMGIEKKYCKKLLNEGSVNTCDDTIRIGLRITNHKLLHGSNPHTLTVPESSCISQCFDDQFCQAVTYIPKDSTCSFHNGQTELTSVEESKNSPRVIIFPSRIKHLKKELVVRYLEIGDRARDGSKKVKSQAACRNICVKDSVCDVFTFAKSVTRTNNCKLYTSKAVKNLKESSVKDMVTYFIDRDQNVTGNAQG